MENKIIDIHCHSPLQPNAYFNTNRNSNRFNRSIKASIWFKDSFNQPFEWVIQKLFGVAHYSQSDFTSATKGQYEIIFVSIYPIENGFAIVGPGSVLTRPFRWILKRFAGRIASTFKNSRLSYIGSQKYNYFDELQQEYANYFSPESLTHYLETDSFNMISNGAQQPSISKLNVVVTIEGAHVLCNGNMVQDEMTWVGFEQRVKLMKEWSAPPFFITFAHHYYNGLCTHAKSLFILEKTANQFYGMRDVGWDPIDTIPPLTIQGKKVLKRLLRNDMTERRILIDIKHMSVEARSAYYEFLQAEYPNEKIPIIFSHGAYNKFYNHEINFNDSDLFQIYKSDGLIGIEIDKRVLGVKKPNDYFLMMKQKYKASNFNDETLGYWFQIISVAEWAYLNGYREDPWKCICIGTDYDGIVNAIAPYYAADSMPNLLEKLKACLIFYWSLPESLIPNDNNSMGVEIVIQKISYQNAKTFLVSNYQINGIT